MRDDLVGHRRRHREPRPERARRPGEHLQRVRVLEGPVGCLRELARRRGRVDRVDAHRRPPTGCSHRSASSGARTAHCANDSSSSASASYRRTTRSTYDGRSVADTRSPRTVRPKPGLLAEPAAQVHLEALDVAAVRTGQQDALQADVGDLDACARVRAPVDVDGERSVERRQPVLELGDQVLRRRLRLGDGELAVLEAGARHRPAAEGRRVPCPGPPRCSRATSSSTPVGRHAGDDAGSARRSAAARPPPPPRWRRRQR